MITQEKFHKLCKYSVRLQKSFISNNSNNYAKYCSHLKYHIGEQIGNGTNQEIKNLLDILTNFISENKDKYSVEGIGKEDKNKINELILELNKIKIQLEMTQKIKDKLESELETKQANNIELKRENEKKINKLEIEIQQKNNEINNIQRELEQSILDTNIIKLLEKKYKNNVGEFINLLKNIFEKIYNKDIAEKIIGIIDEEKFWKNLIITLESMKTDTAKKLAGEIKEYLKTKTGDPKELKNRFENELNIFLRKTKK